MPALGASALVSFFTHVREHVSATNYSLHYDTRRFTLTCVTTTAQCSVVVLRVFTSASIPMITWFLRNISGRLLLDCMRNNNVAAT